MQILRTAVIVVATAVALSADIVRGGTVTFYQNADFEGEAFQVTVSQPQRCYNIGCFNDRASSLHWNDLPTRGEFCHRTRSKLILPYDCLYSTITVYTHADCRGNYDRWIIKDNAFPSYLNDLNDKVSSFMILERDTWASNGVVEVCPFPPRRE